MIVAPRTRDERSIRRPFLKELNMIWGDPADEILKYAREHAVELVVCGTHGRRGFNRLIMSSVAERVLRLAPRPVLTVHGSPAVSRQALTRPAEAVAVR